MNKLKMAVLSALAACALYAQDATGIWQGTLTVQGKELRIMFKVSKGDDGGLKSTMYSIDQTPQPIASTISLTGPAMKITIPGAGATNTSRQSPSLSISSSDKASARPPSECAIQEWKGP